MNVMTLEMKKKDNRKENQNSNTKLSSTRHDPLPFSATLRRKHNFVCQRGEYFRQKKLYKEQLSLYGLFRGHGNH